MKTIISNLFYLSIFFVSCSSNANRNEQLNNNQSENSANGNSFSGEWYWLSPSKTTSFKIIINQKGKTIKGQYCAAAYSGNRMDCEFENEENINGIIKNNLANVDFYSFYGAKGGEATLRLQGDTLFWKIEKWPKGGDCFAPQEAKLTRDKKW